MPSAATNQTHNPEPKLAGNRQQAWYHGCRELLAPLVLRRLWPGSNHRQARRDQPLGHRAAGHAALLVGILTPLIAVGAAAESWYQIEVLIFQQPPADTNELFQLREQPTYPQATVALEPADGTTQPTNDGQIASLRASAALLKRLYRAAADEDHQQPAAADAAPVDGPQTAMADPALQPSPALPAEQLPDYRMALQALPDAALGMANFVTRLNEEGGQPHTVLRHFAWRQPITDLQDSLPIMVPAEGPQEAIPEAMVAAEMAEEMRERPALQGTVQVGTGNYIHLQLDLWWPLEVQLPPLVSDISASLTEDQADPFAADEPAAFETMAATDDLGLEATAPVALPMARLTAERRTRLGLLNYFDHPLIGVLVRLARFEPPAREQLPARVAGTLTTDR